MEPIQPGKYHILMDVIMDASSEVVFVYSAEEFPALFIEANKRAGELLGYTREELLRKGTQDIVAPEEFELMKERHRELLEKGKSLFETTYVAKNKACIPVEISSTMVELAGRKIIITLARDITERKQMEYNLRESEEKFRRAFETTVIGMALETLSGRLFKVNQALCAMLGFSEKELLQKTFQEVTYEADLPKELEYVQELLHNEIACYSLEKRYVHKQGYVVWGNLWVAAVRDNQNIPLYLVSQVEDITLRKRIEESLLESKERYKALIANVPGVVFRCTADGERTMSFISEEINRISEFPVEDFVDNARRSFMSIIHPEDRPQVEENIYFALKKKQPYTLEYRIIDRQNRIHWVREKGQGIYDLIDNVLWIDGVVFDVTEQKHMEIEWQKRVIDLERFQSVTIEREKRIIALKEKLKQLERAVNEPH